MWVHPTDPECPPKASISSKAKFKRLFEYIPTSNGDNFLVYQRWGKEFKCKWWAGDTQVCDTSSGTTASSKINGLGFETPLEWCIAIMYYETKIYSRKLSPKGDLMYNGRSLKAWQHEHDLKETLSDGDQSTSGGKRKQSEESCKIEALLKTQDELQEKLKILQSEESCKIEALLKTQDELQEKLKIVEAALEGFESSTNRQNTLCREVAENFNNLQTQLVFFSKKKGIDGKAMQHISFKVFNYAGTNFEQKLGKMHDLLSLEHSQETRIPRYEILETEVERIYVPVGCKEGRMFSACKSKFEAGWFTCTELVQDNEKMEEIARNLVLILANIRVSYPRISIEPAWHLASYQEQFQDVPFNEHEHEFRVAGWAASVKMPKEAQASGPKVRIVFPMLRRGAEILSKAYVVICA
eukprot:CAMPEP_0179473090 /NCGR_PEP_ID=MMETSP0799-20121207/52920_1 /TAXON_ID=46947 /ORGANISM="Geminigera cryophila, Strain CCMP2564" /LENGTH=411 /DNA_ID=CAMNT_0021281553 /DNA_START=201 /DNA_END=1436 /DNA_ORIENTATION=-